MATYTEKCDTASAKFQSKETGLIDAVESEEEILAEIRQLIGLLPSNFEDNDSFEECTDDLNRACEDIAALHRRHIPRTFQNRRQWNFL